MGMFALNGAGGGGGGGFPVLLDNGIVVHNNGQFRCVQMDAVYPARTSKKDGIQGNPLIEVRTSLGEVRDIDLAVVGDTPIRMEPWQCKIRTISLGLSTFTPAGCVASIWTEKARTGENLATFTAADLASLTSWRKEIERVLANQDARQIDYLYFNVQTASSVPALVSVWVEGAIRVANQEKGLVPG